MHPLETRSIEILRTIVAEYISTGEPVGSRAISRKREIDLSAASIRNVMSDLTEAGFITQPHISAGRIPTDSGYRFYVNALLQEGPLELVDDTASIESLIKCAGVDLRDVLRQSSLVLAELSKKAGVATSTALSERTFKTIEFIKVSSDRIVVVLVSTSGLVQNKMIFDEDGLSQETLDRYSRMLNDMLRDLDLRQAKERIEQELANEKTRMDAILSKALNMGYAVLSQEGEREVFIEGQTNIFDEREFSNVNELRAVLATFEEKSKLLKILDKALQAEGVQIFIGSEHGLNEMRSCSIIAYPIRAKDSVWASISVIGPKRMNYGKVVPLVVSTGQALTNLFRREIETPL